MDSAIRTPSGPASPVPLYVQGTNGLRGSLVKAPAEGEEQVEIVLDSGERLIVRGDALQARPDGSYFLPLSPEDLTRDGVGGGVESIAVPVVRESLDVGKREVQSRLAVHISPRIRKEVLDVPLVAEQAVVERVPVNRFVERAEGMRQEGDATIIPIYEEVLVVERRLRLREEVRITRQKHERRERQEVELRSEEVEVLRGDSPHSDA